MNAISGFAAMFIARIFVACLLLLCAAHLSAAQGSQDTGKPSEQQHGDNARVFVEQGTGSAIRLTVRKATLQQALNEIVKNTDISIHYSTLPEGLVTADCKGTVKRVLACLLGANADMVFRHKLARSKRPEPVQPMEVWLLQVPGLLNLSRYSGDTDFNNETKQQEHTDAAEKDKADNTELLLEMAKDPLQRMEAIASLAIQGRKDDLNVRTVLKEALTDKNAGVRVQAVFALATREGESAIADLQQAMRDKNADVRRMAVEQVGSNPALLQQALGDNDASIRLYAATKLELLSKARQGY